MVNGWLLKHHHTDDIENDRRPPNLWVTLDAVANCLVTGEAGKAAQKSLQVRIED
jgi:hypothetical protein